MCTPPGTPRKDARGGSFAITAYAGRVPAAQEPAPGPDAPVPQPRRGPDAAPLLGPANASSQGSPEPVSQAAAAVAIQSSSAGACGASGG